MTSELCSHRISGRLWSLLPLVCSSEAPGLSWEGPWEGQCMVFRQDVLSPPATLPQAGGDLLLPVPQSRQPAGFAGRHSAFRRSPRQANLTVPRLCLKRWSRAKSNRAWCRRKSPGTLEMGTSLRAHCPDSAFVAGREVGRDLLRRQHPPQRGSPLLAQQ